MRSIIFIQLIIYINNTKMISIIHGDEKTYSFRLPFFTSHFILMLF